MMWFIAMKPSLLGLAYLAFACTAGASMPADAADGTAPPSAEHLGKVFRTAHVGAMNMDRLFVRLTAFQFEWLDQGGTLAESADIVDQLAKGATLDESLRSKPEVGRIVEVLAQYRRACLALGDEERDVDHTVREDLGYWLDRALERPTFRFRERAHVAQAAFDTSSMRLAVDIDGRAAIRMKLERPKPSLDLALEFEGMPLPVRCGAGALREQSACRMYFEDEVLFYWSFRNPVR